MVKAMGLMTGVMAPFEGMEERRGLSKGSDLKRTSGSGECSMGSQWVQSSVVGKPQELAERPGDTGEGEPAESDVRSVPKSSKGLKREIGENSVSYV